MFHFLKSVFTAAIVMSFAHSANAALSASQCAKLKTELDRFIALSEASKTAATKAYNRTCPKGPINAKCTKLKADLDKFIAGVNWAIAEANEIYAKKCPTAPPAWDNHFSPNSPYECTLADNSNTVVVSLGIDTGLNLVNVPNPFKTVCTTSAGCLSIAAQKFTVLGLTPATKCQDPGDQSVLHLTDAELQTKINAIP